MIKKLLEKLKYKKADMEIKVTPYDIAHSLYLQMIRRPAHEHDEIVYTFLRLHCPQKHLHTNPRRKAA